ncbi:hypothetical protein ACSSS7_000555 [Eimeria intestinalis]
MAYVLKRASGTTPSKPRAAPAAATAAATATRNKYSSSSSSSSRSWGSKSTDPLGDASTLQQQQQQQQQQLHVCALQQQQHAYPVSHLRSKEADDQHPTAHEACGGWRASRRSSVAAAAAAGAAVQGGGDSFLSSGILVGSDPPRNKPEARRPNMRKALLKATDESSLEGLLEPVDGGPSSSEGPSQRPGALKRLSNMIMNSSIIDKLVSVVHYFVGPIPGRPDKALLRQSNSVGIGVGIVVHLLKARGPEEAAALSDHIREAPGVRQFIQRFGESADPTRSIKASLQQLLWVRRSCARLALSSYGGKQQGEFLSLLQVFRREYIHLLGFVARCLDGLPGSLPALNLFVERLLVPLQDALKSLSSVSGRFPGLRLTLAQQQLLRWVGHLARLDAALMPLVPGGIQTLSDFQLLSSMDSSLEETDSRHNSQDGDDLLAGPLDSHL